MKKLCKLFYKNDVLGKWIVYDSETKLVSELKKFDKEGKETYINLLEQGMFEKEMLELDHCIKVWEVELMLSEIPAMPTTSFPSIPHDPFEVIGWPNTSTDIIYGPGIGSYSGSLSGGGSYSSSSSTSYAEAGNSQAQNINEQGRSNNYSNSMPSFEVSDMIPANTAVLMSVNGETKVFINGAEKNYKREDEDIKQ